VLWKKIQHRKSDLPVSLPQINMQSDNIQPALNPFNLSLIDVVVLLWKPILRIVCFSL
jgi:hypothetical protein